MTGVLNGGLVGHHEDDSLAEGGPDEVEGSRKCREREKEKVCNLSKK